MVEQEEDFAAMLADFEKAGSAGGKRNRPKIGDQVGGPVISIGKDSVFIDLGGKAEGVLDRDQLTNKDGQLTVAIGDRVEARVVAENGGVFALRVKVARGPEAKAELLSAFELGVPVEGKVTEVIKGGVAVDVAGVRGFCPASQIDGRFVADLATFVGQVLTFKVTKYEARNLVLSRRALVEEANAKRAAVTRATLAPGAIVRGTVVSFKPFGAFVDLGGIEGMLHISELGHGRVNSPEEVLNVGQEIEVAVKSIEPGEKGERISLSLKALAGDPWAEATAILQPGKRVKGKVAQLATFGAFVEIAPNVLGLVHISELGAGRRINHPKEFVQVGQEVEATVLSVDRDKRRIALSMSASHEGSDEDVVAAAAVAKAPAKLGTFADLLNRKR